MSFGISARREAVLVLESGDLLARRDPPVLLPVHADEHVALLEVGAIQLSRRMRPRTELEHHRGEPQSLDRGARGAALGFELLQGGADEDPQPLIRGADHGVDGAFHHGDLVGVTGMPSHRPAILPLCGQ